MRRFGQLTLAICIALAVMVLLVNGLSVRAQGETTIYNFASGWQGWLWRDPGDPGADDSTWQAEVTTWYDWYDGWLTWSDVGLDGPYTGVIIGEPYSCPDGSCSYASIYYPQTISADMIRTYVHRSTEDYITPWIYYFINRGSGWESLFTDDWPAALSGWSDPRYSLDELCLTGDCTGLWQNTPEGLQAARTLSLTGTYQIAVAFKQAHPSDASVFIDQVEFVNCDGCIPPTGGYPGCTTLDDPDFDTGSPWTLSAGASISNSVLSLDGNQGAIQDDIDVVAKTYTATVVARRTDAFTTSAGINIMLRSSEDDTPWASGSCWDCFTDEFSTQVITLTTVGVGAGKLQISAIQMMPSGYDISFEIDYVCLYPNYSPGADTCPNQVNNFDFVTGSTVGENFVGAGGYGISEEWTGVVAPEDADYEFDQSFPAKWERGGGAGIMGYDGSVVQIKNTTAIRYDYLAVPKIVAANVVYDTVTGKNQKLFLYTSYDGQTWQRRNVIALDAGNGTLLEPLEFGGWAFTREQIVFDVNATDAGYVLLALTGESELGILSPNPIGIAIPTSLYFDYVSMDACYGGPNTFDECIFGDPDLDSSSGQPSRFFWLGTYTDGTGAAELPTGTFISQATTPPTAGIYNLSITTDDHSATCEWGVSFVYYDNPELGIADAILPCEATAADTFTATMSLPAYPMTFYLDQTAGTSSVSRICLTLASGTAGQCLNTNPDFLLGSLGYTGDFNTIAGRVTIPNGGKLAAAGVQYQNAPPPYILDVVLSPSAAATVTINHGNNPGYDLAVDASHAITQTAAITYALYSDISGNFGPTLWNLGGGDLSLSRYCIQPTTSITNPYPDPFICGALVNPDFISGTNGWDSSDVIVVNGVASFAPGGYLSQNLGDLSDEPITTTTRWLVNAYAPTSATLEVASDYTPTIVSHNVTPGEPLFWEDSAVVSGTTVITISTVSSGFELDFVCLYPGGMCVGCIPPPLPPGETPGTIVIPPGGEIAECIAPPMGLLPGNITDTMSTVWPWGDSPTNFEVMMAYNTGWVRFIGCRLDGYVTWMQDEFWGDDWRFGLGGDGLNAHLDNIIFLLATLNLLSGIQALLALLQTISGLLAWIVDSMIQTAKILIFLLGLIVLALTALLGLFVLFSRVLTNLWQIPLVFWGSFHGVVTGTEVIALPPPLSGGELGAMDLGDNLYNIVVGLQLINQVAGGTFIFIVVIIAIAVGSIGIVIWTFKQFNTMLGG